MQETFLRPDDQDDTSWRVPAALYNRIRLLFRASESGCLFVPIRSMQYLAVIDAEEIIFVDGMGGYIVQNGQGGRVIELTWRDFRPQARQTLADPVSCEVVFYGLRAKEVMTQLIPAFSEALAPMEQRYRNARPPARGARIIPLQPPTPN